MCKWQILNRVIVNLPLITFMCENYDENHSKNNASDKEIGVSVACEIR